MLLSSLGVELQVLVFACKVSINYGYFNVIFEFDYVNVVSLLNKFEHCFDPNGVLIEEILSLK